MNKATQQVLIAVAASAAAAATAAIITHYLTKQAVTKDIATGNTPLPSGATPTTAPSLPPAPAAPAAFSPASLPNTFHVTLPSTPCPPGYHAVPTGQPNFPYMCIADS